MGRLQDNLSCFILFNFTYIESSKITR